MPYAIDTMEDEQCILLSYSGEMPAWQLTAARYEADAVLEKRDWNRLLVDASQLESDPTPVELYDFCRSLSSGIQRRTRIALLVRPSQARQASVVERIARTGRLFLSYFLDREKARIWLNRSALHPARELDKEIQHT